MNTEEKGPGKKRLPDLRRVIVCLLALGYIISPIDFLPDALPGIGQADDATVALGLLVYIIRALRKRSRD